MNAQTAYDEDCNREPKGAFPQPAIDGVQVARAVLEAEQRNASALLANIDKTLDERGSRYGKFTGHAEITQRLKSAMRASPKWSQLKPDQMEALEMIQHKIGRILNGDPDYIDSWHDIAGYVTLVEKRLQGKSV